MIKKGAMLIETAQELLDETMASLSENKTTPPTRVLQEGHNSEHSHLKTPMEQADELDENLDKVLNSLGQDLLHADHLAHQVGLSSEETLAALTELELMGHVLAESGNRWIRANGVS